MICWQGAILHLKQRCHSLKTSTKLVNAQSGGRSEVSIGTIEMLDTMTRIHFVSKALTNDPRMVSSARIFELEGDTLRYEMEMQTTKVNQLAKHLEINLQHIK